MITEPEDTTASTGDTVIIKCEVSQPENAILTWFEHISKAAGSKIFSVQPSTFPGSISQRPEKFEVDGYFNLVIKDAALNDGGLYSCDEFDSLEKYKSDVIILGKFQFNGLLEVYWCWKGTKLQS